MNTESRPIGTLGYRAARHENTVFLVSPEGKPISCGDMRGSLHIPPRNTGRVMAARIEAHMEWTGRAK